MRRSCTEPRDPVAGAASLGAADSAADRGGDDRAAGRCRAIIGDAFSVLVTFVAYVEQNRQLLRLVPHVGGKLFWINPTIPLSDRAASDELAVDEPGVAEYHKLQPEVTGLLESRQSQRHILAREAGS